MKDTWSNLTINQIEVFISSLKIKIPCLNTSLIKEEYSYANKPGSDVKIQLSKGKITYTLLIEVEQYASGKIRDKIKNWSNNHFQYTNTTTIVIGLLQIALSNILLAEAVKDNNINRMVYDKSFRLYSGIGNGSLHQEVLNYIEIWIIDKL